MKVISVVVLALTVGLQLFKSAEGHGRLMNPPSRSSIWRFQEFAHLNPIPNYNDNELFCGGFAVQHEQNGGQCGECGDAWNAPRPRDNELGGTYGQGFVTRHYRSGEVIEIEVELTAVHLGYFEFRLCDNRLDDHGCLDRNVLQLADGSGTRLPVVSTGTYKINVRLPAGVTCQHCVLQWHYYTGNRSGECADGSNELGCGPQETFRGCADIQIS